MSSFDLEKCKNCANEIFSQKFGRIPNFRILEDKFDNLRKTKKPLSYKHLRQLKRREFWDFEDYWILPDRWHLRNSMKRTKGIFLDLPNIERKAIDTLNNIFKNIELVSIVMRFVDPHNYGIMSPPVKYALKQSPSENYTKEYLEYLQILRNYAEEYNIKKVADTEIALWSLVEKCIMPGNSSCPNFENYQVEQIENEEKHIKTSGYYQDLKNEMREKEIDLFVLKDELKCRENKRKELEDEILSDAKKQIEETTVRLEREIDQLKTRIEQIQYENNLSLRKQGIFKGLLTLESSPLAPKNKIHHSKKEPPVDSLQWNFMEKLAKHLYVHRIDWRRNSNVKPPHRIHGIRDNGELTVFYVGNNNYAARLMVYPIKETDKTNAKVFARLVARHMGFKEPKT